MKVKAYHELKKRRKTASPSKTSESRWSKSSIKFLADFYGIECSEESILACSKHVVVR
jgi:hypothetical protein